MILAAGRGERMRELTQQTPKPLLRVQGKYLIEHAIKNLTQAGIKEIVINVSYQGAQIKTALGNGERYGVAIYYSEETERLETGGGIKQALSLLGEAPFVVMSCDIVTHYPIQQLPREPKGLGHLIMVNNPAYHAQGDFILQEDQVRLPAFSSLSASVSTLTFGNIGVLRPELFASHATGYFRLAQVLLPAISQQQITGEHYQGYWYNIGTPQDLQEINLLLSQA